MFVFLFVHFVRLNFPVLWKPTEACPIHVVPTLPRNR